MKVWFWMLLNRNAVIREVKRLELQVANQADFIPGNAAHKTTQCHFASGWDFLRRCSSSRKGRTLSLRDEEGA